MLRLHQGHLLGSFSASLAMLLPLPALICSFWPSEFIALCSGESLPIAVSLAVTFSLVVRLQRQLYRRVHLIDRALPPFADRLTYTVADPGGKKRVVPWLAIKHVLPDHISKGSQAEEHFAFLPLLPVCSFPLRVSPLGRLGVLGGHLGRVGGQRSSVIY